MSALAEIYKATLDKLHDFLSDEPKKSVGALRVTFKKSEPTPLTETAKLSEVIPPIEEDDEPLPKLALRTKAK